ncbi:hypothetical protein [Streptacidiphilus fuscans]|uniref:Secreted protein n=1 Tax=Streptacidiphilus fuscans TaxID=2789292 RepID=A0A931B9Q8_9ACTN|nr:hypothetical protein [Streptacidiphilus fuscans]MBF9072656.1 hypothetical protein [Streptacidiphilus fuscans]
MLGAVLAFSPAAALSADHARAAVPAAAATASPTQSPCPGGEETTPCPASSKDRDDVDNGKAEVAKEEQQNKQDIADAKAQSGKCPPTSKQCMTDLTGDGKAEKDGMAKAEQQLDSEKPAPTDNASGAVGDACKDFGAQLPPGLAPSDAPDEPTRICELMH